jgi:hypothetical protein
MCPAIILLSQGEQVPHHLLRQRQVGAGVIATAVTASTAAIAIAASAALSAAATSSSAGTFPARAAVRPVLLLNGDRVVTLSRPGGRTAGTLLLPAPGAGTVFSLRIGSRTDYIPADALPFMGRGLSPGLFDLADLRRAETSSRLTVQVTFTGHSPPGLPGVTITRSGPGSAEGYLTASSARVFGAALARQFRADHGRASYGTDGLFAGGVTISPAGSRGPARAQPQFPMHELTVTGTNLAGQPDTGDPLLVFNADDPRTFGDPIEAENLFYHGTARYSVPAGHYWAVALFATTASPGISFRLVVLPQFTVQGSQTRVHMAARAASSELRVTTPRPSVLQVWTFTVVRNGPDGGFVGGTVSGGPGDALWVSPTAVAPSAGSLHAYAAATLASPANAAGTPYVYNLALAGPAGIIPVEHWVVDQASLATVTERYYQDVSTTGSSFAQTFYPQLVIPSFSLALPVQLPGLQIQYFSGNPSVAWESGYIVDTSAGGQFGFFRTLRAGQHVTEDWNKYPLHPQRAIQLVRGSLASLFPEVPTALRAGNTLWLFPLPFSDNEGHAGTGFQSIPGEKISGSYAIYQDGVRIGHGNPANSILPVTLSNKPSVIRFELSAARPGASVVLSPASQTVWTWRSAPRPRATLPPSWICVTGNRRCVAQPMMTLDYHVHGLSLHGTTTPGPQVIGLTVGHLQLSGHAPVTGATALVSYDGGRTWRPADVTPAGGGNFAISFTAPAGANVTLRTSATDAAGGSITETIQDAYQVQP